MVEDRSYNGILMGFLDSDFYKFTMQQAVYHNYPSVEVEYDFKCRSKDISLVDLAPKIKDEIMKMADLKLTKEESKWLSTLPEMKSDYISMLEKFRYNPEKEVRVFVHGGELNIIIKGTWLQTILYEVPILAIVEEIYTKSNWKYDEEVAKRNSLVRLKEKVDFIKGHKLGKSFKFIDFGTRRRASASNQDTVVRFFNEQLNVLGDGQFIGTSNVHLAMKYGLTPKGSQAHEWYMAHMALCNLNDFQEIAMDVWTKEYDGLLSVILTDTINMDVFLKSFGFSKAKLNDGCRQDSGDPYKWGEKLIKHYDKFKIPANTKTALFSDGLTVKDAFEILDYFNDRVKCAFGIGTSLTYDIGCVDPASIVIKMQSCNGFPVAKISETPEKAMSRSPKYLEFLKEYYNIK